MGTLVLVLILSVFLLGSPAAAQNFTPLHPLQSLSSLFEQNPKTTTVGTNELSHPVWMAVVLGENGTRFLLGSGDPIFQGSEPQAVGVVRAISPVSLTVRLTKDGREVRTFPGRAVPGARQLILEDVVFVKTLEYRNRIVDGDAHKLLDGELYLAGFQQMRAILQRDVDPPPSPTVLLAERLEAIPVAQTDPRTWEVKADDVQTVMQSGEQIVNEAIRGARLDLSPGKGLGVEVKSPIADVRFDKQGFLIASARLAGRIGLLEGDRILDVNGMPIDSVYGLVQAYRAIKAQPSINTVRVTIERDTQTLNLNYRIR